MARGYLMEEAIGLCTEYMQECSVIERRVWDDKEEPAMTEEVLEGNGRPRVLSAELRARIHEFVLNNVEPVQDFRRQYLDKMESLQQRREEFRRATRGTRQPIPEELLECSFASWLPGAIAKAMTSESPPSLELRAFQSPPCREATSYKSMYAYGNHIRVRGAEGALTTCDSGIATVFSQSCQASAADRNPRTAKLEYVGWVDEIISVNYGGFEVVVLYCSWVQANMKGPRATMKRDEYGFTLVRFDRLMPHSSDSFAFPIHAQQVFFADDVSNPGWKVVLRTEARGVRVGDGSSQTQEISCLQIGQASEFAGLIEEVGEGRMGQVAREGRESMVLTATEVATEMCAEDDESDNNDTESEG